MRLKRSRLKTILIANKITQKDNEGGTNVSYGVPQTFTGTLWPSGGELQVQKYGDRVDSVMNCKIEGSYTIEPEGKHVKYVFGDFSLREDDGVYVYGNDAPDYRIVSIKPYRYLFMELERL